MLPNKNSSKLPSSFNKKLVSLVNFDRNDVLKIIDANKAHDFVPLNKKVTNKN